MTDTAAEPKSIAPKWKRLHAKCTPKSIRSLWKR
jgi:hypothetical protein